MKNYLSSKEESSLSYSVNVNKLPIKGVTVTLDASDEERVMLAKKHDVHSVNSFVAELHIFPWKKRGVKIKGHIHSDIIQECVVTLEPLSDTINEEIEVVMVPEGSKLSKPKTNEETGEIFIDVEGPDLPEVFKGDTINLGALVEEFFELSLNPYPRKEGVEFESFGDGLTENTDKIHPFEILKKLKDN